jgi:DUF3014 family protein
MTARAGIGIGEPPRRRRPAIVRWLAVAIAAAALGVGGYLLLPVLRPHPPQEVVPPPPTPAPNAFAPVHPAPPPTMPPPAVAGAPEVTLPPLAESDALVRGMARELSPQSPLSDWLSMEGLIPRFVAAVDNVADGESPSPNIAFLKPTAKFQTVERNGRVYLDPRSYARYDAVANVVSSLDPHATVALYRKLQPLYDDAYRDLGHPDGYFDDALARAIPALLATPVLDRDVELVPKVVTYAFADPKLEGLRPAQKHFLRMGPRNVGLIQVQLRALAAELRLPESQPAGR